MKTRTIKYISLEDIKAIAQQIGEQTGTKHIQEIHITISPVTPEGEAGPVKVEVIGLNIDQEAALKLDQLLLRAEAAAGMQDGFPVNSALVAEETLILK